jgi:hypothetical protein
MSFKKNYESVRRRLLTIMLAVFGFAFSLFITLVAEKIVSQPTGLSNYTIDTLTELSKEKNAIYRKESHSKTKKHKQSNLSDADEEEESSDADD